MDCRRRRTSNFVCSCVIAVKIVKCVRDKEPVHGLATESGRHRVCCVPSSQEKVSRPKGNRFPVIWWSTVRECLSKVRVQVPVLHDSAEVSHTCTQDCTGNRAPHCDDYHVVLY